jgi:hypothetical protein
VQSRPTTILRVLAASALALTLCGALSACSPGVEYPSIFPAVHDMPPPRADAPLDADQVQQATEDLITQRNHLSAGAAGQQKNVVQSGGAAAPKAPAAQPAASANAAPVTPGPDRTQGDSANPGQ